MGALPAGRAARADPTAGWRPTPPRAPWAACGDHLSGRLGPNLEATAASVRPIRADRAPSPHREPVALRDCSVNMRALKRGGAIWEWNSWLLTRERFGDVDPSAGPEAVEDAPRPVQTIVNYDEPDFTPYSARSSGPDRGRARNGGRRVSTKHASSATTSLSARHGS